MKLCLCKPMLPYLVLIICVNNYQSNLVAMFVYLVNNSSLNLKEGTCFIILHQEQRMSQHHCCILPTILFLSYTECFNMFHHILKDLFMLYTILEACCFD
jgi:hypothetical protein